MNDNAVLHAFEDWWGTTGQELLHVRNAERLAEDTAGVELDAFEAGVKWERERVRALAKQFVSGEHTEWIDA